MQRLAGRVQAPGTQTLNRVARDLPIFFSNSEISARDNSCLSYSITGTSLIGDLTNATEKLTSAGTCLVKIVAVKDSLVRRIADMPPFAPRVLTAQSLTSIQAAKRGALSLSLTLEEGDCERILRSVLCVDEKTGIQALDRTQSRSWTNEYVRHGTRTLLPSLDVATERVIAHVRKLLERRLAGLNAISQTLAKHADCAELASIRIAPGLLPEGDYIPILSNVFLYKVLDQWFEQIVKPGLHGRAFLVRFADDNAWNKVQRNKGELSDCTPISERHLKLLKTLIAADLHFRESWFEWLINRAAAYDAVLIG
jgi:hypothetical protein